MAQKLILGGLAVLAASALLKFAILAPREVNVAAVVSGDIVAEVQGTGTVTTERQPRMGSKINGRIEQVLVDEGELVNEGELIVVLEEADLRHQVEMARARLEAARASAWRTKLSWERARELVASNAISEDERDIAEEEYRIAESAIGVEEAELRYREFKLSETKITSPVTGLVTKRWIDPGDAVVAGQPLVTVAETATTWIVANVDQRFADEIRQGQPATVLLRGRSDKPIRGEVYRVNPHADPVTEEMRVEVAFPLPPEKLQIGWWAEVYIEVGKITGALVVPKAAVLPFGNDRFVFVAQTDGTVRRVKVELGPTSPRLSIVAVTGELQVGERVILKPIGLQGGETVHVGQTATGSVQSRERESQP